jgi:hypothetical protein
MGYRDECQQRLASARKRIDEAIRDAPTATSLLETWYLIWDELKQEDAPEADRLWLADRMEDLRLHVHNSQRWREALETLDTQPASRRT